MADDARKVSNWQEGMNILAEEQDVARIKREKEKEAIEKINQEKYKSLQKKKNEKIKEYIDRLNDIYYKIVSAVNYDVADKLYDDAIFAYKEATSFLNESKGKRHFPGLTNLNKIDDIFHKISSEMQQKRDDLGIQLIKLATTEQNKLGDNERKINEIILKLNKDYDYNLLSEENLKNLKTRLNTLNPNVAKRLMDSTKHLTKTLKDSKTFDQLDSAFDKIEHLHDTKKITNETFDKLFDVYEDVESKIRS